MEKMNDLLEKYFQASTTLTEENELKQYFRSANVKPEHELYRPMFQVFDDELTESVSTQAKEAISVKMPHRFWLFSASISGIAATLVLAFWLIRTQPTDDYAIMRGKRINNPEFAQQYAEAKMDKLNDILNRSMKPMQSINKVRHAMEPLNNLSKRNDE
jgi:hypothetical protein